MRLALNKKFVFMKHIFITDKLSTDNVLRFNDKNEVGYMWLLETRILIKTIVFVTEKPRLNVKDPKKYFYLSIVYRKRKRKRQ